MLGFGFACRDKGTTRVLGHPGKLDWGGLLVVLICVRFMEVGSTILAINMFHVSARSDRFRVGGPMLVATLAMVSCVVFPHGTWPDVLAAVIAHPGQLLEAKSRLPLWGSLLLNGLSSTAVVLSQALVRSPAFADPHAKVVPKWLLGAWLSMTCLSWLGRLLFAHYADEVKHPMFQRLANESTYITYSAIKAELSCPGEVPPAVLASLPSTLRLDPNASWVHEKEKEAQALPDGLALVRGLQMEAATMVAIGEGRTGQLFSILAQDHELEDPVVAFPRVRAGCRSSTSAVAPRFLRRPGSSWAKTSRETLQELDLFDCSKIPAEAWQQLGKANWTKLRKANFVGCFEQGSKGASGAVVLLAALAHCHELEELHLNKCTEIPAEAWQQLRPGSFPRLRTCHGVPPDIESSLRSHKED
ncbi:unnamed protein product [Durusdinium trenchii]|uniref:Uncharacterized protein n=1 Tax=Durusdinium trenchii TaxID=1381693 RepID=A0ABP0P9F3_9DINO